MMYIHLAFECTGLSTVTLVVIFFGDHFSDNKKKGSAGVTFTASPRIRLIAKLGLKEFVYTKIREE